MVTLSALKSYLQSKQQVSLAEIVRHFGEEKETIQAKLTPLVQRGLVIIDTLTPICGKSCRSCSIELTQFYRWA